MSDGQEQKAVLVEYLQTAREAVLWKLEGLGEHDVRRPLTPTGTNLLGLVKHLASNELGYFGDTFDRPHGLDLPWYDDPEADPNDDLWVRVSETREDVVGLYRTAWAHAADTFAALDLDAVGHVPWWGGQAVTLQRILVHVTTETYRHAGHADILRESLDGQVGRRPRDGSMDEGYDWAAHVDRVEQAAREAGVR